MCPALHCNWCILGSRGGLLKSGFPIARQRQRLIGELHEHAVDPSLAQHIGDDETGEPRARDALLHCLARYQPSLATVIFGR
jgi:hypothetical protein